MEKKLFIVIGSEILTPNSAAFVMWAERMKDLPDIHVIWSTDEADLLSKRVCHDMEKLGGTSTHSFLVHIGGNTTTLAKESELTAINGIELRAHLIKLVGDYGQARNKEIVDGMFEGAIKSLLSTKGSA